MLRYAIFKYATFKPTTGFYEYINSPHVLTSFSSEVFCKRTFTDRGKQKNESETMKIHRNQI